MIYLTSFKRYFEDRNLADSGYYTTFDPRATPSRCTSPPGTRSSRSWTCSTFGTRMIDGWEPRDFVPGGDWSPHRREDPDLLRRYHDTLLGMYRERWDVVQEYAANTGQPALPESDIALCCWCPYDKAAQRQLEDYGSFVCHSWPVETFLRKLGVDVHRDVDRQRMVRL